MQSTGTGPTKVSFFLECTGCRHLEKARETVRTFPKEARDKRMELLVLEDTYWCSKAARDIGGIALTPDWCPETE